MQGEESAAARAAWRWVLITGFAVIAALNLPGHLPLDSVTALWEGRNLQRMSWGPRMYSAILGFFDRLAPGTGLFAMASLALTALAWAGLPKLRSRIAWSGPLLLLLSFTLPQLLIWQGILWRDVLFGNLTVAAFVALAAAARFWERPRLRWALLAAGVAALAFGALVRQNGGVVIVPWGLALGWIAAQGRFGRGAGWAAAGIAAPLILAFLLNAANPVPVSRGKPQRATGQRLVAHYDLMGALAADPTRPMPWLEADRPLSLQVLRREAKSTYSPTRIDTLDWNRTLQRSLWRFDSPSVAAEWREMIVTDPLGYARRRLEVFRWVFLTPDLPLCVPLHLGVDGLPQVEKELGLTHGQFQQNGALYKYAERWFRTPFYSHLTYALAAAAVAVFLLMRRDPPDIAIAALMVGVLGFTATFVIVSLACDYRYLYALDLAAITGVLYVALDPTLRRRKSG